MQEAPHAFDITGARPNTTAIVNECKGLSAMPTDGCSSTSKSSVVSSTIQTRTVFFFLSGQLGHTLEKEGETSLGQQRYFIWTTYFIGRTYPRQKMGRRSTRAGLICKRQIFIFKNPVYDDRILRTNYVLHKKYVGNLDFDLPRFWLAPRSIY